MSSRISFCFSSVFILVALALNQTSFAAEPIKDSACMECHSDKSLTKTTPSGREVSVFVDLAKLKTSVHKTNTCASCHADITDKHPDDNVPSKTIDCARCHRDAAETYNLGVHGLALAAGRKDVADCSDCHDGHTILPPSSPESPLHYSRLAETCGGCHEQEARDVEESIHGKALALGHRDAPTCTDCHSEHRTTGLRGSVAQSADICSTCHASEKMNTKFRLPSNRVKTFYDSYHGLAAQYGSTVAANCGSCHGYHKILPSSDAASSTFPARLAETCGKCHPGATENFARSKVHIDAGSATAGTDIGEQVNWWVRRIYLFLIVATIGFMLVHNLLVFAKKVAARYRRADLTILRMNLSQRWQHMLLAVSFITLAVTGFALKFPDSWVAKLMGSSEAFRRWSHRIAGVVMLVVGAYHVYYILATRDGRKLVKDMFPVKKDIADVAGTAAYLTGLKEDKPKIARFGYAEKMEYWAVVWGTIIMGVTGLMVWFKMDVTRFLPRWLVDVALTIHYYEAILACLAIIVWHFYHVIFDPDVYPLNWACWNGKVSRHWHEDEHALEQIPTSAVKQNSTTKPVPSVHEQTTSK